MSEPKPEKTNLEYLLDAIDELGDAVEKEDRPMISASWEAIRLLQRRIQAAPLAKVGKDARAARTNRDAATFEIKYDLCRECRTIQQTLVVRGWQLCRLCIEEIDRHFTNERAEKACGVWNTDPTPEESAKNRAALDRITKKGLS